MTKGNHSLKFRNKKLVGIFTSLDINIRLIGEDNPKIILNDKCLISCVIKDFNLFFLRSFNDNNAIKVFDFKNDSYISEYEINELIGMCEQQPVFRIRLKGTDLCIVGYNFDEEKDIKFPVFAISVPWLYLTLEDAELEKDRLTAEGYDLEVI
ncbi:MAG: hypothetical protein HC906_11790 [Bacteroidales bacterium]|nr:hypothetical protein [Bacteroidales bacterium]